MLHIRPLHLRPIRVQTTKKTGLHKARENGTGTWSIGKTWDLDSLGPIQSYHELVPDVGFSVSLGKPYCEWKSILVFAALTKF
jgi:hypothetical protein